MTNGILGDLILSEDLATNSDGLDKKVLKEALAIDEGQLSEGMGAIELIESLMQIVESGDSQ